MFKLFETVNFFPLKHSGLGQKFDRTNYVLFFNLGPILENKFQVNQRTIDNLDAEVQIFRDHNFFFHFLLMDSELGTKFS